MQIKEKTVSLFVVEEQEIYREVYRQLLPVRSSICIAGVLDACEPGSIRDAVGSLRPDVLMLSIKKLDKDLIRELEAIRNAPPRVGIVILFVYYSSQDSELLRRLALSGDSGMALFLKHSLDKIDHLCQTITAV